MTRDEFRIGARFWAGGGEFQCTDIGSRVIVAIAIGQKERDDPSWLDGPPYAVGETVFDENDMTDCSTTLRETRG